MNTREAYQALLDGKKILDCNGDMWEMDAEGDVESQDLPCSIFGSVLSPFKIFEEPATDEELIAEMKRIAAKDCWNSPTAKMLVEKCATMLKTRKVSP